MAGVEPERQQGRSLEENTTASSQIHGAFGYTTSTLLSHSPRSTALFPRNRVDVCYI